MTDGLAQRLAAVRSRIAQTGRNPDEVVIVAVTKGFGPQTCQAALDAGLTVLGENRVHEAKLKMDAVPGAEWHLIGHLQTNKVRQAAGSFALIHSVDSVRLAAEIARVDPKQEVLLEVNVAREAQKQGDRGRHETAAPARVDGDGTDPWRPGPCLPGSAPASRFGRAATRPEPAGTIDGHERGFRGRTRGGQHHGAARPGAVRAPSQLTAWAR
jgi:hypothetical protein